MYTRTMTLENNTQGIEVDLPNARLILIATPKGYLMCGYLNLEVAEKKGDCAAIIAGVSTIEELLRGTVASVTSKAEKAGILPGMTGEQALAKIV